MHRELEAIRQDIAEIKDALSINKREEYMDVKQVAKLTGLSRHTIYKYSEFNHIPVLRIQGVLRFKRSEILEWMESKSNAVAQ